jgi:hypothetical protein
MLVCFCHLTGEDGIRTKTASQATVVTSFNEHTIDSGLPVIHDVFSGADSRHQFGTAPGTDKAFLHKG